MTDTPTEDTVREIKIAPPTSPGFYKYDGGNQNILFLLMEDGEWFAYFNNGEGPLPCDWGYIEQGLGVFNLDKLESKDAIVSTPLPVFLPGNNRNWEQVDGHLVIYKNSMRLRVSEGHQEALVDMAKNNVLLQVAFDYRLGLDEMRKINSQFQMEYSDDDTLFKAYDAIEGVLGSFGRVADVMNALSDAGIVLREMK